MNMVRKVGIAAGASLLLLGSPALAEGDAAKGEKVFKKCGTCHSVEEGKNKINGPSLYQIVGRTAGAADGFAYSKLIKAAAEAGLVWSEEALFNYLVNPQAFLVGYLTDKGADAPGTTRMPFRLPKEGERTDVIAYLKSVGM